MCMENAEVCIDLWRPHLQIIATEYELDGITDWRISASARLTPGVAWPHSSTDLHE